jgi:acyl carrier protein
MSPDFYFSIAKVLKIVIIVLSAIAAVVFFIGVIYLPTKESRIRKRKLKQLYESRQPLGDDEFHEMFFESRGVPKNIVVKIRRILEDEFLLDMSRIIPDDDFTGNLAILWGHWSGLDGLEAVEVVTRFEREFGIKISDAEAASIRTVEDVVLLVWRKVEQNDTKASRIA